MDYKQRFKTFKIPFISSYARIMQSVLELTLSICSCLILPPLTSTPTTCWSRVVYFVHYVYYFSWFMLHKLCILSLKTTMGNFRCCSVSSVSRVHVETLACSCQLCMGGSLSRQNHARWVFEKKSLKWNKMIKGWVMLLWDGPKFEPLSFSLISKNIDISDISYNLYEGNLQNWTAINMSNSRLSTLLQVSIFNSA